MIPSKRVCYYLLPRCFQYPSGCSSHHLLRCFRFFSATYGASHDPSPSTPSIVEYLVSSCGFSRGDAVRVSASPPRTKTSEKADAVVQFLRRKGLGEDNIRRAVLGLPSVLCSRVDKTLEPKIRVLQEAGFSSSEIGRLISTNPHVLRIAHLVPKIEFWRNLLGTKERVLKVMSESRVVTSSLDSKIKPNVSLLRETGLAEHRIARIISRRPRIISCKIDKVRSVIERVQNLGISPESGMFADAVSALANISKTKIDAKMKLLRSFGWSEDDFLSAFQRSPQLVRVSEKKIREVMGFLLGEVGCEPSYVALRPRLLWCSLEKKLMPRHSVLRILKSKGLPAGQNDLLGAVVLGEELFMERYVLPYGKKVPELLEAYSTAVAK